MQIINQNRLTDQGKLQLSTIKRYWQLFIRHWYVTVIALAIAFGSYLYYASTVVEGALAQIQISLKYNEANTKSYTDYSDEMTGINAPSIVQQTIESLHLDATYYVQKDGGYKEVNDDLPFKITVGVVSPELYESYIKFKILNAKEFELSYDQSNTNVTKRCFFDSAVVSTDLKLEAEKNHFGDTLPERFKNVDYFVQIHDKPPLISKYQSALKTKLTKDLAVLQVTYRDIFPKRAVQFLDTLARAYLNKTIKSQMDRNSKMVIGIDKLLGGTEGILRRVEDSLRKYSIKTGMLNENIEEQKYVSEFTDLMTDKRRLDVQRMVLKDLEKYIIENQNNKGLPPPYFSEIDDPFLSSSLVELYKLEVDKKDNLYYVTEKSSNINKMDNSFENRKKDLLKYVQNTQKVLDDKIAYFEKQIAGIDDPAQKGYKGYNKDQLYVLDLKRQLKVNETMYMNLLEKRNNILIAQASMAPEYKIFEAAHIIERSKPAEREKLIYFLLMGLVAAFGVIYLINFFFEEIETMEYLKTKTMIPVLGEMPYMELNEKFNTVQETLDHPLGSSLLGAIRTNLEFELAGKKSKVILITSHNSSEGKTFNAVNLGAILAKAKKRVLLLDMDFHKPNLANVLGLRNKVAGMDDLYDHRIGLSDAIISTGIDNMDAIISLSTIGEASEKILSETTAKIIEYGKKNYDYVIIDTPPVGIISDALTLMQFTDLNIYILNAVAPYKNSLTQVDEIIERNHFKIHLILNKVKIRRLQYYSRQYYNYRYARAS
jgi:tyrosine-protein kinase Etk/Wzc